MIGADRKGFRSRVSDRHRLEAGKTPRSTPQGITAHSYALHHPGARTGPVGSISPSSRYQNPGILPAAALVTPHGRRSGATKVDRRRPSGLHEPYLGPPAGWPVVPAPFLLVASEPDPVASRVVELWGAPPATGDHVDGVPIRQLGPDVLLLRRAGLHVQDERLDLKLPPALAARVPTLVFASVHRSRQNVPCFTVHPLGNVGPSAEVGGRPRTLVPTDPRAMAATLRALGERSPEAGLTATYEATHHGPELALPAFFAEIGYGTLGQPAPEAVRVLAATLREIAPDPSDRAVLGVGGGHYAPHFTELAVRRRWAFGHILSRHALADLDAPTARSAFEQTPEAVGILYARDRDAESTMVRSVGPRRAETDAPLRSADR